MRAFGILSCYKNLLEDCYCLMFLIESSSIVICPFVIVKSPELGYIKLVIVEFLKRKLEEEFTENNKGFS